MNEKTALILAGVALMLQAQRMAEQALVLTVQDPDQAASARRSADRLDEAAGIIYDLAHRPEPAPVTVDGESVRDWPETAQPST